MVDVRVIELIHAEIDGQLDAAGLAELEAALRADPEAASLRAELAHVTGLLEAMSQPDPGPGLKERILAALPAATAVGGAVHGEGRRRAWLRWPTRRSTNSVTPTNLFGAGAYTSHPRSTKTVPGETVVHVAPVHAASKYNPRGTSEMSKNRIYALAALAAGIGAVGYFGFHNPPMADQVFGTIAPAQRYQAPTVKAADVVLGDQSTAKFMQSDVFRMIQSDAQLAATMRSDSFRQALASDSFRQALASDSFRQALASDTFRQALASDAFKAAMLSDAAREALSSDTFRQALASDSFRQALRSDSFRQALSADSFRQALRTDASRADAGRADASRSDASRADAARADASMQAALRSDSFRQALASDSFRQALASDSFRQALASDSFRQALRSDSFRQALASDSFRQALASDSFRQALASDSFRQALRSDSFRQALASDTFRQALRADVGRADASRADAARADASRADASGQ